MSVDVSQTKQASYNIKPCVTISFSCSLFHSHSSLGGLQPKTQQLSYANAPISSVPWPSSIPHLQIQEVHIFVITSPAAHVTWSYRTAVYIYYHILHYWWYQMSTVWTNQLQSRLEIWFDESHLMVAGFQYMRHMHQSVWKNCIEKKNLMV